MEIVKKFVKGDFPLKVTFWVFTFIPQSIYTITKKVLNSYYGVTDIPWIIIILFQSYRVLCIIALWNSSERYKGKKRWFYIVRFYIAYDVIYLLYQLTMLGLIYFYYIKSI